MQDTRILIQQPRWYQNQQFLLGATATVILWFILSSQFSMSGLLALSLSVQIVLFFSLFYRPVWAMAALIVGQLTANSYMVALGGTQVSIRLIWTVLALFLVIPVVSARGGIKLGKQSRAIIIPAITFFVLATIANVVDVDISYTMQYVRTGVTALAIVFFIPIVVKNEKDLKILAMVTLITCVVSAFFALMQHYTFLGLPSLTLYPGSVMKGRVVGLTEGPVHLAYDLSVIILPLVALYFFKGLNPRLRKYVPLFLVVIIIALYFSYTRSGLYSLAPGLLVMALLIRGKMRRAFLTVVLVLIIGFLVYVQISGSRYSQGFGQEQSATSRLALWQAGAKIAMDYPIFGIGQGRFEQVSVGYVPDIQVKSMPSVVGILGQEQPHNDFLRVWLSFGTLALLAYLALFVGIFRNFYIAYRKSTRKFTKALALGCFAALVAYIVNAATHNLMDTVPLLWILAGLAIAVVKLPEGPRLPVQNKLPSAN